MADAPGAADGKVFARLLTPAARERLREFDLTTRDELNRVMDELAEDPDRHA